jgi:hypothetical protein
LKKKLWPFPIFIFLDDKIMGEEEDHNWHTVRRRHRNSYKDRYHLPDIATAKNMRRENLENLTTYFFTDFPDSFGAKAMFNAFGYYGNILEIVIPAKRDKGGRRFGFARFDQIHDARRFEMDLDKIMIGRDKISVNLSRFHRTEMRKRRDIRSNDRTEVGVERSIGEGEGGFRRPRSLSRGGNQTNHHQINHHHHGGEEKSYAHAVKKGKELMTSRDPHRVLMSFEAKKEDLERLQKAFVGEVIQAGMSYNIQDAFHRQGYFGVKVTPLGANLTLLEGQEEGEVQVLIDDAKGWLDQWFKDIRPWNPKEIDNTRVAWLRVFGIPPHAWNDLFFVQLVKPWGEFMRSDDGTTKKLTMDVARILIRTSCQQTVDEFFDVLVNGVKFHLRVVEDAYGPMRIILPLSSTPNGRDLNDISEEEDDEEEDEEDEAVEFGQYVEEEVAERDLQGDQRDLIALTPNVNVINSHDNFSVAVSGGSHEREQNPKSLSDDLFFHTSHSGGGGILMQGGVKSKKDNSVVKDSTLLGQEEIGGPQTFSNNQVSVAGGVDKRLVQSDVVVQTQASDFVSFSGGTNKQQGGVYSDGPRQVYLKLNHGPTHMSAPPQTSHIPDKSINTRIHPIPASIRKQQKLISKLHLRTPASKPSQVAPIPLTTSTESVSRSSCVKEFAHRNPPARTNHKQKQTSSLSSAGEILCCSSLNSSDIRNCNKRYVDNFNHTTAQKVWKGANDLGVVGVEGEEAYVKRILINENSEEEARILREQFQQNLP